MSQHQAEQPVPRSSSLTPYPEYKDSDVEWLGEVPAHWGAVRLKMVFSVVNGSTPQSGEPAYWDGEIPWVTPEDLGELKGREMREPARYITEEGYRSCGTTLVPEGSLILSTRAPIGHLAIAGVDLCTNQGCKSLVFRKCREVRFFFHLLVAARPELQSWGRGSTFQELSKGNLENLLLPLPPETEQRAIAAFLDQETAKIDVLVAKKERLIELLQEKRAALISDAVTKGLDPSVPMKDSGVEWLGKITAHWMTKHLRWAIMFQRGHDLPTDEREDGQVPIVSSSGISSTHSRALAKAPGIVTGRYGTIGHFHLITQDYWPLNTTLYSIDLRGNDPRFLRYMLTHLSPLFLLNAVKSAVPGVDRNDVHPTRTAVPPLGEQLAIVAFLDRETARIDALVAKVREGIERSKEYRTALISAAVTGKIDVRGVAVSEGF
jgi:type I restriction enzyme S subunit